MIVVLPRNAMGFSAVCDCSISCSYLLTILGAYLTIWFFIVVLRQYVLNDGAQHLTPGVHVWVPYLLKRAMNPFMWVVFLVKIIAKLERTQGIA